MVQVFVAIGFVASLFAQSSGSAPSQSTDRRTWSQAYEDGKRAIEQKNWNAAMTSLERARAIGPKPGRDIPTYGDNVVTFVPDYFLGLAYLNLGRFADADAAYERARQQSVLIPKDREWGPFQADSARAAFEHQMQIAEERLAAADFKEAMNSVTRARKRGVGAELLRADALQGRILEAEAAAKNPTTGKPTTANPPPPTLPGGTTGFPGNLGTQVTQTPPTFPGPTNPSRGDSTAKPGTSTPRGPSTTTPPPSGETQKPSPPPDDPEQAAMTAFFNGEYASAEKLFGTLTAGQYPNPRHQFFLACTIAARMLAGETDRARLEEARGLYATSGGRGRFRTESTYISPRILDTLEGR